MIDPEKRRQDFIAAAELLGGQRALGRILGVSERTVRYLVAGDLTITRGFMRDLTHALRTRATDCAQLAKATDPLFTANLTAAEIAARPQPTEARRG